MDIEGEKAMEQQERKDANLLLERNYRRQFSKDPHGLRDSIENLDEMLSDLPAHIYHRAIKDHILDEELGQWFPQPSNIKAKSTTALADYRRTSKEEEKGLIDQSKSAYEEAKSKTVKLKDPYLISVLGKTEIECIPNSFFRCQDCGDTGWVVFYYFTNKKAIVYSKEEHSKLYDDGERDILKKMRSAMATCTCQVGCQIERRYADNPPNLQPPNIYVIQRLIERRKQRVARASQRELL